MTEHYDFEKEKILPSSDSRSPFYYNLPNSEGKPIDNLIEYFKYWKYFIRALTYYFKELAIVKEFESNINLQLINAVQFPGYKDLPVKILNNIKQSSSMSPSNSQASTPTKELNKQLMGSSSSLSKQKDGKERPQLHSTKSNSSIFSNPSEKSNVNFIKNTANHKRASSANNISATTNSNIFHNDLKIPANFYPQDSLFSNLSPMLVQHHQNNYTTSAKLYRDLTLKLIPRLDSLYKTLSLKIKEIKTSLKNESFANSDLSSEISNTGQILTEYMISVETYNKKCPVLNKKLLKENKFDHDEEDIDSAINDPFLLKMQVDYQIKKQLTLENYMFASYVNLQKISQDLFTYVTKELTIILDKFGKLELNQDIYKTFKSKLLAGSSHDWEYFISHNPNFLNTYQDTPIQKKHEIRYFKNLTIPYSSSIHNKCIRSGLMYKKQKILKSYTKYYYLLTCNYLHEYKIESDEKDLEGVRKKQRDKIGGYIGYSDIPINSYNLNDLVIDVKDDTSFKFQLTTYTKSSTKITFKCVNQPDFDTWTIDLQELLKFTSKHFQRFELIESKFAQQQEELDSKKKVNVSKDVSKKLTANEKFQNQLAKDGASIDVTSSLGEISQFQIQTPAIQYETNPFDNLVTSPESSGVNTPVNPVASPVATPMTTPPEHGAYLKMQQQLIQSQLNQSQLDQVQLNQLQLNQPTKSSSTSPENQLLTSPGYSSSDSISSFIPKGASIQSYLPTNTDYSIESGLNFEFKPIEKKDQTEVPKVFVSGH